MNGFNRLIMAFLIALVANATIHPLTPTLSSCTTVPLIQIPCPLGFLSLGRGRPVQGKYGAGRGLLGSKWRPLPSRIPSNTLLEVAKKRRPGGRPSELTHMVHTELCSRDLCQGTLVRLFICSIYKHHPPFFPLPLALMKNHKKDLYHQV